MFHARRVVDDVTHPLALGYIVTFGEIDTRTPLGGNDRTGNQEMVIGRVAVEVVEALAWIGRDMPVPASRPPGLPVLHRTAIIFLRLSGLHFYCEEAVAVIHHEVVRSITDGLRDEEALATKVDRRLHLAHIT